MKFENTEVFNFKGALKGMRNPKESWNKSDSHYHTLEDYGIEFNNENVSWTPYLIGENDMKLAQTLILAGTEHSKFLRQIFVSVDITAPLYWYKEFDTYKINTTANSTSTMHKITSRPITIECFETDDFWAAVPNNQFIEAHINFCEELRQKYLETKDIRYWKELIRWLPESWLQTRTWTANYAVLRNMYFQRKDHKLSEWHTFCNWIESLPYAKELITITKGE